MKTAKTIKKYIDTISGKRRLTILNKYVTDTYKSPNNELRNITTEYSPRSIVDQMKRITTYIKSLCGSNGKTLGRYYSYTQIQSIERQLEGLQAHFEGVSATSSKTVLKNLLTTCIDFLENIKPVLGPFIEFRLETAVENYSEQTTKQQDALQQAEDITKEIQKQANTIQKNFHKSEESEKAFDTLLKESKQLKKALSIQQTAVEGAHARAQTVSKHLTKLETQYEDKLNYIDSITNDMEKMRERIEQEYQSAIERSRELDVVAVRMEQTQEQTKNIINQAKYVLSVSQGAGFLESYRDLYKNASRAREFVVWTLGAIIGFFVNIFLITQSVVNTRSLPDIMQIFLYPTMVAQLIFVPFALFAFFFCLFQIRRKNLIKKRYHLRFAALETYLKLSEHLPYDSPEQMRTASVIMRYIEEDFDPVAVRSVFFHNRK